MEVRVEVGGGVPPAKGEAKSMLSKGHPQAHLVRRLLMAAADAMTDGQVADGRCIRRSVRRRLPVLTPTARGRERGTGTYAAGSSSSAGIM